METNDIYLLLYKVRVQFCSFCIYLLLSKFVVCLSDGLQLHTNIIKWYYTVYCYSVLVLLGGRRVVIKHNCIWDLGFMYWYIWYLWKSLDDDNHSITHSATNLSNHALYIQRFIHKVLRRLRSYTVDYLITSLEIYKGFVSGTFMK